MKIGIISVWFHRGASYIAQQIADTLNEYGHEIKILVRPSNIKGRIKFSTESKYNLVISPRYIIPENLLLSFSKKLDGLIFIEEHFTLDKIKNVLSELDIWKLNYVVWENVNPSHKVLYEKLFDKLICPTRCSYEHLSKFLSNCYYIPWGIDLNFWKPGQLIKVNENRRIRMFFPEGWGGVFERKNLKAVMNAFSNTIPTKECELYIHTQYESNEPKEGLFWKRSFGDVPLETMVKAYHFNDLVLLPSKWEGLGLPFMEALATARPVITLNKPPMNEIINEKTGILCKEKLKIYYNGIYVPAYEIDELEFSKAMLSYARNKKVLREHQENARKRAEEKFDWNKNKKHLLDLINELS